jgi:predicted NBD/HSP70 family sugar kinase
VEIARRPSGRLRGQGKTVPEDGRRQNRQLVLQSLFDEGPRSRADLARSTELTPATISDLVAELLDEGLLETVGRRQGQVGKPSTLVAVVPDARHIVCLDLSGETEVRGAVVNLMGKVVTERTVSRRGRRGDGALRITTDLVTDLVSQASAPLLGVGIGTPGIVDDRGRVLEAPNLGWNDLDLRAAVQELTWLPVHIANDANAAALAEFTFGSATGPNLVVVKMGLGVGAGLVLNGELFTGDGFAAGEIGHVVVDERGPDCACGNRGCLETLLAPLLRSGLDGVGEPLARKDQAGAGRRLGIVLAPVVSAFDVHRVILSAPEHLLGEAFPAAVLATLRKRTLSSVAADIEVGYAANGDQDVLLGAAVLVLSAELGVA